MGVSEELAPVSAIPCLECYHEWETNSSHLSHLSHKTFIIILVDVTEAS